MVEGISKSLDRYDMLILECSNIHRALIKIEKDVDEMHFNKLSFEDKKIWKNTMLEIRLVLDDVLNASVIRKYHKKKEPEWYFQARRLKLQKINEELINILHKIKYKLME